MALELACCRERASKLWTNSVMRKSLKKVPEGERTNFKASLATASEGGGASGPCAKFEVAEPGVYLLERRASVTSACF